MGEKGFFQVYQDQENPRDIHYRQIDIQDGETIPESQLQLRDEVDRALTTLKAIFEPGSNGFEEHFRALLALAQLGLVGDSANPQLAMRALATWKNEILASEGGNIKNGYMKNLGKVAIALAAPVLLVALVIPSQAPRYESLAGFMYLWVGCMAGVWLSFGARKVVLKFDELAILEEDRLNPRLRLIFAGLLTIIIGLFLSTDAVVLELGGLKAAEFETEVKVALLIGAFCGLSEQVLSPKVMQHAREFLNLD